MGYATTILGLCAIAFIILYISGRYYLREEGFENMNDEERKLERMAQLHATSIYNTTSIREDIPRDPAYATKPIMTLDDYEYSMVFQNEGNREAGKFEISQAMTRYPLDWCGRPPSDQLFQTSREAFTDKVAIDMKEAPVDEEEYDSISGVAELPPNTQALDDEERKLLQTYKPESTKDLLHYSLMDAKQLAKRYYKKKGLIPIIEPSKQGENVFEIVELKEINPKIVWEDEVQNPENRTELRGEGKLEVPQIVNDTAAGLDPFFEPRTTVRMNRHDYTKWTPGLERTFAPTYTGNGWA
jgi:hypothetical protein